MLLTAVITSLYILMGTFRSLVVFIGLTECVIYILTVLAVFRLRKNPPSLSPQAPSPPMVSPPTAIYRTNTANPYLFCFVGSVLVGRRIIVEPYQGGALIVVGLVLWVLWLGKSRWSR